MNLVNLENLVNIIGGVLINGGSIIGVKKDASVREYY